MKRKVIIYLILSAITSVSVNSEENQQKLEYKPFKKTIYHISSTGTEISPESPLLIELVKCNPEEKSFDIKTMYVSHRDDPSHDLSVLRSDVRITDSGLESMINIEEYREGVITGVTLAKQPFIFPLFPKKAQALKITDAWEIITYPVVYDFTAYDPINHGDNAIIKFKWTDTTRVDDFVCAKIDFSIHDQWKDTKTGDTFNFKCDGIVYFAIEEGIIVSEWLNVAHDIRMGKVKKTNYSSKKVRLIHYEPYESES